VQYSTLINLYGVHRKFVQALVYFMYIKLIYSNMFTVSFSRLLDICTDVRLTLLAS